MGIDLYRNGAHESADLLTWKRAYRHRSIHQPAGAREQKPTCCQRGQDIICGDAPSAGQSLCLADQAWFPDVEEAKEEESCQSEGTVPHTGPFLNVWGLQALPGAPDEPGCEAERHRNDFVQYDRPRVLFSQKAFRRPA